MITKTICNYADFARQLFAQCQDLLIKNTFKDI